MKRKLTVTITKSRRQVIAVPAAVLRVHCSFCERDVNALSIAQAAAVLAAAGRMLDAVIASGQVHVIGIPGGSNRVCQDSLFAVQR